MIMKILIFSFLFFSFPYLSVARSQAPQVTPLGELIRIDASPEQGFHHPFFLYIPTEKCRKRTLLVAPNNTGSSLASLDTQVQDTQRRFYLDAYIAERTRSVLLVPAFPRPNVDPPIYTHALSRSTLGVSDGPLKRLDLQLIQMIEASRNVLKTRYKIELNRKISMMGFSAAGSFVNRFAILHPDIVTAAAVGSPGGWPIAPVSEFRGKPLNYPTGIADVKSLVGKDFNLKSVQEVSFFFFVGDKDENDSVPFRDSFSENDESLIFKNFGRKPIDRWPKAKALYSSQNMKATFKVFPGVAHELNRDMREAVIEFLSNTGKDRLNPK